MNTQDIYDALTDALEAGMAINGSFPNVKYEGDVPYYEVTFLTPQTQTSVSGEVLSITGQMSVNIATQADPIEGLKGTHEANGYAQTAKGLFAGASALPFTDGKITIQTAPNIEGGYNADGEWRVPVMVRYIATAA